MEDHVYTGTNPRNLGGLEFCASGRIKDARVAADRMSFRASGSQRLDHVLPSQSSISMATRSLFERTFAR